MILIVLIFGTALAAVVFDTCRERRRLRHVGAAQEDAAIARAREYLR
jgi:hypothetical protein